VVRDRSWQGHQALWQTVCGHRNLSFRPPRRRWPSMTVRWISC